MSENINVVPLRQPNEVDDPLTNILRSGARQLLAQAVEMEAEAFLLAMKGLKLPDGRTAGAARPWPDARSNGYRSRRGRAGEAFGIARRPKMASGSASPQQILRCGRGGRRAWTRFCRCSTFGEFRRATSGGAGGTFGPERAELSPAVISRLTTEWQGEYERWQNRDLSARRYVYVWAEGVFLQARMEDHGECMLVLIGATRRARRRSSASRSACGKVRRAGANFWSR